MYGETQQPNLEKWHHFFAVRKGKKQVHEIDKFDLFFRIGNVGQSPLGEIGEQLGHLFFQKNVSQKSKQGEEFQPSST